jgi:hypothetical protein
MSSVFYVGLNPRWQYFTWLPEGINVMYSAGGFWNASAKGWRRDRFMPWAGLRFLDCGGFTLLNKYGDYPFTVPEYMNLVAKLKPDYYATLDYPCEPDISRKVGMTSNLDRIRMTVAKAGAVIDWAWQVPGQVVPVIQGYTLSEYKKCIDLYAVLGTLREYMAVGSMCRRISSSELARLIEGIHEHAKQAGVKRLHFFGLKLSPDLQDLSEFIYSRDSAVAMDDYDGRLRRKRGGRRFPRGQAEKKEAFESFLRRLDDLGLEYVS